MTIDVSTPEARQAILSELERLSQTPKRSGETVFIYPEDSWLCQNGEDAIEAAFTRIAEVEDLAHDLADAVETLLKEHKGLLADDEMHNTCSAAMGSKMALDRARAAGGVPGPNRGDAQ